MARMSSTPRVVVITGASSGIGAAFAELAAKKGAIPVLAARRVPELGTVTGRCGEQALPVVANVAQRADVERIRDAALERFGRIDVWINNAGRGITRPVSQLTDDDFDEIMRVNVKSALYGMQTVLPHFKARGRGHIINMSSLLGRIPLVPTRSVYSAAKAALNSLTANLRMELREEYPEIFVSSFLPGVVATEFGISAIGGGIDSRRFPGAQSPDEVAAILWGIVESPRADVYSRPAMREQVAAYYAAEDMAALEAPPVIRAPSSRRDPAT